jgi:hypothetical protein
MSWSLASVRGKVVCQLVTEKPFGAIRLCEPWQIPPTRDGRSLHVIAEDHGGNAFCTTKHRAVWFWDHETDDTERLAGSIAESVAHCIEPPPVRLDRKRVKSVWMVRPSRNGLASRCPLMAGQRKSPSRHKASEKTFLRNILAATAKPHAQRKICMLPG